jgi:hypothetical protein
MKNTKKVLPIIVAAILISNCSNEQDINTINTLDARLVAFDEAGVESTLFEANTNIRFALNLINDSNKQIEAGSYYDYCAIYSVEEFLLVYKWIKNDNGEDVWAPIGKAYVPPIACPTINIPVVIAAHGEATVCGMEWDTNPNNLPIGPGKYYTALTYTLELGDQSKQLNLRLDFEVQ